MNTVAWNAEANYQLADLEQRIAALEENYKAEHSSSVIEGPTLDELAQRVAALECKHKDLDAWTIHQFSRLEPRIAALEKILASDGRSIARMVERIAALEKILNNILAGEHLFKAHNNQWIKELEERIALSILNEDASHERRIAALEEVHGRLAVYRDHERRIAALEDKSNER